MTTKPREFWIRRFEVDELLNSDYKFTQADISKSVPYPEYEAESDYKDAYHVVEKRALDAANAEIKLLREALEIACEALEYTTVQSGTSTNYNQKCNSAMTKIREKMGLNGGT